jgi:transcriptional regulator with XRE-family HTH domain
MLGKFIKKLRIQHNLSQSAVAHKLDISRPTYMQIEKEERDLTIPEAKKLADLFNIPFNDFIETKVPNEHEVTLPKKTNKTNKPANIRVPADKLEKFKAVLLYILEKVGAKPNVGETVIYKLLYFIDFNFYEKYEKKLIGATYIKNHHGPTPVEFKKIVNQMIDDDEIEIVKSKYFKYDQRKYLPIKSPRLAILSGDEIQCIKDVLERLSDKNAAELSEYSHRDVPWMITAEGEKISYGSVFYRTPEFAQRDYDREFIENASRDAFKDLPALTDEEYEYYMALPD